MDRKMRYFRDLYNNHREYALLQWAYALIAAAGLVVSGLVALMNQALGISILIVPGVFGGAFLANLVAWSLLNTILKSLFAEGKKNTKNTDK